MLTGNLWIEYGSKYDTCDIINTILVQLCTYICRRICRYLANNSCKQCFGSDPYDELPDGCNKKKQFILNIPICT